MVEIAFDTGQDREQVFNAPQVTIPKKMTLENIQIVTQLEAILGANNVLSENSEMVPFISEPRKRFHETAQAVVMPRSIADLQTLVRWANNHKIPLIPQGGNTGMVGGQVPLLGQEIIVNMGRLNKVRQVDADGGHMIVEAGLILEHAHGVALQNNMLFPLTIASKGSAQIGGVLSTNAGGTQVLAYGNARALCLGVEAVLPDGSLYQGLNGLKKNNTGYDLSNLLVGAEGTLGFITAASLKLFPKPSHYETAWINVASPQIGLRLLSLMQEMAGNYLTAFELMPRFGIDMQLKHTMIARDPSESLSPWYVMAEMSLTKGRENIMQRCLEEAFGNKLIEDAIIASTLGHRELMWATREQMSASQSREGASIKHDVSVPISKVPELIERGCAVAEKLIPGIRPCPFGHMGDGNIHFNFSQPQGADPVAFMASAQPLHDAIYEIIADMGGSISAEHGIGQLKVDLLAQTKDPVALTMMGKIKHALDPNNICNPGKILAISKQD